MDKDSMALKEVHVKPVIIISMSSGIWNVEYDSPFHVPKDSGVFCCRQHLNAGNFAKAYIFLAQAPAGLESNWRRRTHTVAYSHRVWNDAYLVALAEAGGFTNVSFDQGFCAFGGTKSLVLR